MKCLIVEDELPAIKILESYISKFSDLEIGGIFYNAMDAITELQKNQYDILFLDIQLPGINGMQMLQSLRNYPSVIFTTAHREYAIDSYEFNVCDYLLKPISFERFAKAIAKVYQEKNKNFQLPAVNATAKDETLLSEPFIYVKSEREHIKILLSELLYVESIKNHVKLYLQNDSVISLMNISYIEDRLPRMNFMRIHRSFIVSKQHISRFNPQQVNIGSKFIPVGRLYKQNFLDWMNENVI